MKENEIKKRQDICEKISEKIIEIFSEEEVTYANVNLIFEYVKMKFRNNAIIKKIK